MIKKYSVFKHKGNLVGEYTAEQRVIYLECGPRPYSQAPKVAIRSPYGRHMVARNVAKSRQIVAKVAKMFPGFVIRILASYL